MLYIVQVRSTYVLSFRYTGADRKRLDESMVRLVRANYSTHFAIESKNRYRSEHTNRRARRTLLMAIAEREPLVLHFLW